VVRRRIDGKRASGPREEGLEGRTRVRGQPGSKRQDGGMGGRLEGGPGARPVAEPVAEVRADGD
jgi:hypothetical protein